MTTTTIELAPHSPRWAELFAQERTKILTVAGAGIRAIEHIGSTSIPSIVAKPIVDIGVAVDNFEEAAALVPAIEGLEYLYRGEFGIPRRHYFVKGDPRQFHLHMLEINCVDWRNHLLFRDYLRSHPETAAEYERLKEHLAATTGGDRMVYTERKVPFIQEVLRIAWATAGAAPEP